MDFQELVQLIQKRLNDAGNDRRSTLDNSELLQLGLLLVTTIGESLYSRIAGAGFIHKARDLMLTDEGKELLQEEPGENMSDEAILKISHSVAFAFGKHQDQVEEIITHDTGIPRLDLLAAMTVVAPFTLRFVASEWAKTGGKEEDLKAITAKLKRNSGQFAVSETKGSVRQEYARSASAIRALFR